MSKNIVESSIPQWLNVQFVEKNLRNYYKNDGVKIVDFYVKPFSAKENGFTSSIYRVKVNLNVADEEGIKVSCNFFSTLLINQQLF